MTAPESRPETDFTARAEAEDVSEVRAGASAGNEAGDMPGQYQTREDLEKALNTLKKSEVQLRRIIDTIPIVAWWTLPQGPTEFVNQRWYDYTGFSPQEAQGWRWTVVVHPEDLSNLLDKLSTIRASGKPGEIEARLRRHDGEYRWFLFRLEPLHDETGNIVRWCGTNADIESLKQTEEKLQKALNASQRSEVQLRRIIDAIPTLAWCNLPDGSTEFLNQRWLDYTGLSLEEARDYGWKLAIHPEDLAKVLDQLQKLLTSGKPGEVEARLRRHDGEYRWFLFRGAPLRDEMGNIVRWYGTNTDIESLKQTEKKLEEALDASKKSEVQLQKILDTIPTLAWCTLPDGSSEYNNERLLEYTGLSRQELRGYGFKDAFHPEDLEKELDKFLMLLASGEPGEMELRLRRHDGEYRWFLVRFAPLHDELGNIVRWYGTNTDIDDLKKAQVKLRQDEEELRRITDVISQHIVTADLGGNMLYANQALLDYTGLTLQEVLAPDFRSRICHPEDFERLREFPAAFSRGLPFETEVRVLRKDGQWRWFLIRYKPFRDEQGRLVRWYSTGTDIDDRKRSEDRTRGENLALREEDDQLRKIIDTIPTLAWSISPDGSDVFLNQRWYDYTKLSPQEATGYGWTLSFHPEDVSCVGDMVTAHLASGKPGEVEARLRRHDGEYRWFLIRFAPLRDETGKIVRWYGTNTEIESLKQTEEMLRQDERELRRITDAIPQVIVTLDPEGVPLYVNRTLLDYTGLTVQDFSGADLRQKIVHAEDIDRLRGERQAAYSRGLPFEVEQRLLRKDGRYRWFLIYYNPFHDEQGHLVRWYATGTDIDDRKRSEDRTRNENVALREETSSMFEEIVGSSGALRPVLAQVSKVAPTDSTVLILGETGTGKELIARAIHKRSRRSTHAFIKVNLAAISPSLIASELFGHEKGSFTGAVQRRLGRFELADGGTLFLDEIGEPPPETQVALLRVLQEREFERVGGSQTVSVDVRVIAATNRDLSAAVAEGMFREDLFYRLNVFPIRLPALRERGDDIRLLVEYLIDRYAQKAGKKIRNISGETLDLLRTYDWPGNVRELQNVVERAVILCDGETLRVDGTWLAPAAPKLTPPNAPLVANLVGREKEMIENALQKARGVIGGPNGAAAKLGIPRQTLESKIRKLGINRLRFKNP